MKDNKVKQLYAHLKEEQKKRLLQAIPYNWNQQARPSQRIPSGDWLIWLILAGRGFGKTRTGAETIRHWIHEKGYRRIALIGQTFSDTRHVMVEGVSGLIEIHPPEERPEFFPSRRLLRWPNGASATLYSGDTPDQLRGPQFDAAWIDELAKFKHPEATFDQLMLALRLGCPKVIITTTPRPLAFLKSLTRRQDCVVTRGTSFENTANLSAQYIDYLKVSMAGTGFGAQEVMGEILEEDTNALWLPADISYETHHPTPVTSDLLAQLSLQELILSVDPAVTGHSDSNETGIILLGRRREGTILILADYSLTGDVNLWTDKVYSLVETLSIHAVIVEINQGGDLIETLLRTKGMKTPFIPVRASRSKWHRAAQVSLAYKAGHVRHYNPLPKLEQQLLTFSQSATGSPDRMDALVWGLIYFLEKKIMTLPKIWGA